MFIVEAIESVLMQKTSFNYELVIGEDCSTDKTREICENYARDYPKIIRLLTSSDNLGMNKNFIRTLESLKGKYVALLEGDDYWTDPLKLQKQVDFLEGNNDYSICFHKAQVLDSVSGTYKKQFTPKVNSKTTIFDLARCNYIHTPTVVYRKNFQKLPPNFSQLTLGDYPLHMLNAQYGNIKCINREMAVYRVHSGGVWSNRSSLNRIKGMLSVQEQIIDWFDEDVREILYQSILENKLNIFLKTLEYDNEEKQVRDFLLSKLEDLENNDVRKKGVSSLIKLVIKRVAEKLNLSMKV